MRNSNKNQSLASKLFSGNKRKAYNAPKQKSLAQRILGSKGGNAYDVKSKLPEDQYGRHRDRINSQQMERRIKRRQGAGLAAWLTLGAIILTLGVWFIATLLIVKVSITLGIPFVPTFKWHMWGFIIAFIVGLMVFELQTRRGEATRLLEDDGVINDYDNDMYIQTNEEMLNHFAMIPDNGAHFTESVATLIGHIFLDDKKTPKVNIPSRYDTTGTVTITGTDEDGNKVTEDVEVFKGEIIENYDGDIVYDTVPMIDKETGEALFEASGITPDNKVGYKFFQAKNLDYSTSDDRPRQQKAEDGSDIKTVYDLMEKDWEIPDYETQRPSGVYLADTNPVNTLVLAITRGGKGQTIIEPTLDAWTREKRKWNIVVNDPKGELLVKFMVPAAYRGYEIVQFNLINPMNTNVYNPLGYAVEAARDGNYPKVAEFLTNLSEIFFPKDGGEDKVWPESAAAAFERSCLGLIDYYLEEEREMRRIAELTNQNPAILDAEINNMWGKVTLFNCFQFFLSLVSKKETDPYRVAILKKDRDAVAQMVDPETGELLFEENGDPVVDYSKTAPADKALLDLFFDATSVLPRNGVREQIDSSNNTLKTMMQSEKMLSSVYGIATSGMRFFADPTIISLTSGAASQNFDIQSLSFPRRLAIRFSTDWMERYKYAGKLTRWSAYTDDTFTEKLDDKLFAHDQVINRDGWTRYTFDGKFENMRGYVKMDVIDPRNDLLMRSFYFRVDLDYQKSLDGTRFIKDPILGERIVRDGKIRELRYDKQNKRFRVANTTIRKKIRDFASSVDGQSVVEKEIKTHVFSSLKVAYSEKPKMVFFITPPHLMAYARLILILIKQVTDSAMESAYLARGQKPLYGTRYMLDELGNLQSDGHGIPKLETMLSIGLSAMQQFTLILQTMQQLIAVYGDSVDKIIKGNTNNIIFLKSTDIAMIDELVSLGGKRHNERQNSITVTQNTQARVNKNDGRVSITKSVLEEDNISRNDFLQIKPRESIVFAAGENPIYNQEATILPMAWRLHKNQIKDPRKEYTLQTIPTTGSALEFDARRNQPNFYAMVEKRVKQARLIEEMEKRYRDAYGYEQIDIDRLDPDVYAGEIMDAINDVIRKKDGVKVTKGGAEGITEAVKDHEAKLSRDAESGEIVSNDEYAREAKSAAEQEVQDYEKSIYAQGRISAAMLVDRFGKNGHITGLEEVYNAVLSKERNAMIQDTVHFKYDTKSEKLYSRSGVLLVDYSQADVDALEKASDSEDNVYLGVGEDTAVFGITVKNSFGKFLYDTRDWSVLADGKFERSFIDVYDSIKAPMI